jgi:hypothetical protein
MNIPPSAMPDTDSEYEGVGIMADVPMQPGKGLDVEYYKHIAANSLANQIVKMIDPEFIEDNNFEILRYSVVVIRNGSDGRNKMRKIKK